MSTYTNQYLKLMEEFLDATADPLHKFHSLLREFVVGNDDAIWHGYRDRSTMKLDGKPAGLAITKLKGEDQSQLIQAITLQLTKLRTQPPKYVSRCNTSLFVGLNYFLSRKRPLERNEIVRAIDCVSEYSPWKADGCEFLPKGLTNAIEIYHAKNELDDDLLHYVKTFAAKLRASRNEEDSRKLARRLEMLTGAPPACPLRPGKPWFDAALTDLDAMETSLQEKWNKLLDHCLASSSQKGSVWLKSAEPLVNELGWDEFRKCVLRWFPLIDNPRHENQEVLKGLAQCCSFHSDSKVARLLAPLAISAYKKVPGIGPRAIKVGNACVYALGAMPGMDAVGQLALLKVRIKFRTAQNGIEKALTAAAEREGIARDEIEEMSVPAYGLTEVGLLREPLGEFTAELAMEGRKPEIRWIKPDGKRQKTVPAAVKKEYGEELKELKASAKDIEKMLPAQATRIEQAYLQQKEWSFDVWRERYLDHPLVGILARRLIWKFQRDEESVSAIFYDDQFVGSDDQPIDCIDEKATVQLWHPLDESTDEIVAWRDWLLTHEVQQPFKQAYREVYLLTDAERNTGVYSNRFAAHVLKQHQFNALCGARGWKNQLRLAVDDDCPPTHIVLPQWDLRAEFWVESVGEEWGVDTNDAGTFYYLTTDQVRFYRSQAAMNWTHVTGGQYESAGQDEPENHPLRLDTIPPLVLSEVLRDVDLFVGVASVGNDPNWGDGGAEGRYRDYWNDYSFGDLAATAQTRKSVLERLVPRLKIADRCTLNERFLVVRGDVRTYKIHLGSGNILMEPNDAYLCIVPAQSTAKAADKVFLPFEGDRTLSIILSKAFLLAEDKKIKDPTILSQIRG